ncbi:MAG: hypothetical protein HXY20_02770 [Acidobacteria bacterium]|nr:hypothetical protein [Acidobacteriota bacterium]
MPPRFRILCLVALLPALAYALGRLYAPVLVEYVVEETLLQKAPTGMDPALVRSRLASTLAASPDRNSRLKLLFEIARSLEKYPRLTPEDMDRLVPASNQGATAPD